MAIQALILPTIIDRRIALAPVTPGDEELINGLSKKPFLAKLTRVNPRSVIQNKFYWAVLREVVEHQDLYQNATELHLALKVKLGYVESLHFIGGQMLTTVKSTSFDAMDPEEFKHFMDAALALLCEEVIPGTHRSDLLRKVESTQHISYNALWQGAKAA
ncbi:hypothetical protein [Bradyrhizobium sp. sGM-13]|uniref:hypothetical protein n=1 Tax=Bradyrhizobium sp. sGM-13 TaxID=2831781 RepID=UPI001BCCC353|nr:hypothetical protein [Bradyrhizobium sp. sGM-13]